MKTLTVAAVFLLSMVSLFTSLRADALSTPRIEKGVSRPEPLALMPQGGDDKGGDGKGGGKGGNDSEDAEEEYRALSQRAALELVDPGALDDMIRLRAALRYSR